MYAILFSVAPCENVWNRGKFYLWLTTALAVARVNWDNVLVKVQLDF